MAQAMTQSAARVVPEFAPERIDVDDVAAIRASLDVHGYACIKEVASEAELQTARDMLWEHLEGRSEPSMRQTRPVGWKRGVPTTWLEGHGDGLLTSGTHAPAMWFVRSLPGVVRAFEAAYGEPAVAAYDRMSVNLPVTSGNPAALRVAETRYSHGKLNAMGLHTHYNQDGYGDEQLICYAIFNFWDMDKAGGASELPQGLCARPLSVRSVTLSVCLSICLSPCLSPCVSPCVSLSLCVSVCLSLSLGCVPCVCDH